MILVRAVSLPTVEILSATVPCGWQNRPARMLVSSRYRSAIPGAVHQQAAVVCVQIRRSCLQRFRNGEQGRQSLLSDRFHHQMTAFLAQNRFIPRQPELAPDMQRPAAPVAEQTDVVQAGRCREYPGTGMSHDMCRGAATANRRRSTAFVCLTTSCNPFVSPHHAGGCGSGSPMATISVQ